MAQIIEEPVKGSLTREQLEFHCGIVQEMSVCKLIRISKKADPPGGAKFNLALFEEVDLDDDIPKPTLVEIKQGDDVSAIIQKHLGDGKKFIFDATIFVENADQRILGFR